VDWKSSAKRWPKAKAAKDWQPTAFIGGYAFSRGLWPGFRFDVVTKAKTPALERHETTRTPDDFIRLAEFAKLAESMSAAGHFAPNEQGFYCAGCPYREPCRNWHRERSRVTVRMAA
jgi:putative RecB family exonuclease